MRFYFTCDYYGHDFTRIEGRVEAYVLREEEWGACVFHMWNIEKGMGKHAIHSMYGKVNSYETLG